MKSGFKRISVLLMLTLCSQLTCAQQKFTMTLENHLFTPSELVIPANTKVRLIITNKDASAEEFDSFDLNREKVLFPNRATTLFIGPLKPGRYTFFGEFNPSTAKGVIIVEVADAN